ncbi:MAG: bifunctional oligoribonuclease/PAP phosphatase NrnA, partial [Clostridiales bacterium]|nr:bifunctional oligoribonuclease/PAP phosphatase NrnA [Clostridiales bacterium]
DVILEKIESYEKIIICRHSRPDGDAVGSTMGLRTILRDSYPNKEILLINEDYADYTSFLGKEDGQKDDAYYSDALVIVIDTGTTDRISNTKFALGKEIVKIDHHIDEKPYGDVSWVEDYRSSACEMIAAFYDYHKDKLVLSKEAATYLYAGMVTDSGRFKFSSTSGDTLRLAAILIDKGIDTDTLFANLYLSDYNECVRRASLTSEIKMTENGVAYLYISKRTRKKLGMTLEQASATVSLLESIRGCIVWLAFIENDDGSIRVRLRSRFATVQKLASRYNGGGHECASGATVYSKKEMRALLSDADALIKDYKSTHEGWL